MLHINSKSLILNLSNMKINYLKLGIMALMIMAGTAIQAQTDPTTTDTAKQADVVYGGTSGSTSGSIRVIDNMGTIKYLQSNNGITTISNTAANGDVTTTTWQLGGTLVDDTYIDVDTSVFALDGIDLVDTTTLAASTDATTQSDHGTGTGWTLLVRDEATGAIKKLKATDLIKSGTEVFTGVANTLTYTATSGVPLPADISKLSVYRNGAKLRVTTDYTVSGNVVTLIEGTTAPNQWSVMTGDQIEIQWFR